MPRPSYDTLDLFAAVGRTGSFTQTAKDRGISAAAVSLSIKGLETRLGVRLLNRTTRSVSLTEAGEALLHRLHPALEQIDEAVVGINAFRETPSGTIRINAPAPAVEFTLLPLAAPFLHAYPDVTLEIINESRPVDIVEGRFDAGVRFGEEVARDMIAVQLGPPLRYVIVGSPDYFAQHGVPREPADLTAHHCLRQRFAGGKLFDWQLAKDGREVTFAPKGRVVVNDARHLVHAAEGGLGLARVLDDYAQRAISEGRLVEVLQDWCPRIPSWFLYYPSRRQLPPAMRVFLDFIALHRKGR